MNLLIIIIHIQQFIVFFNMANRPLNLNTTQFLNCNLSFYDPRYSDWMGTFASAFFNSSAITNLAKNNSKVIDQQKKEQIELRNYNYSGKSYILFR